MPSRAGKPSRATSGREPGLLAAVPAGPWARVSEALPQLGCGRSPRLAASPRACAHCLLPPAHLPVSASGRRPQPGMGVRCPADDAADHAMTRMGPSSLCGESRGACSEFPGTPAPPPQSQDSHTRTGRAPQALGSGLLWTEGPCCAGQGGTRAPGRVLLGSDRPSASCSIRDPAASPLGPRGGPGAPPPNSGPRVHRARPPC